MLDALLMYVMWVPQRSPKFFPPLSLSWLDDLKKIIERQPVAPIKSKIYARYFIMALQYTANVAPIFGAISIFLTLIFVMLEIRLNLKQFRAIKEISLHDVQNQFFLHWSDPGNAELILKARADFSQLSEKENIFFLKITSSLELDSLFSV